MLCFEYEEGYVAACRSAKVLLLEPLVIYRCVVGAWIRIEVSG